MSNHPSYPPTPRVNSAMLGSMVQKTVRFVGKIHEQNGTRALLFASDKGQVEVHQNSNSLYGTKYMEIIGVVNHDKSISEMTSTNFGNDFDMESYNELIKKEQQFPSIF